jgi:hypothetical protein
VRRRRSLHGEAPSSGSGRALHMRHHKSTTNAGARTGAAGSGEAQGDATDRTSEAAVGQSAKMHIEKDRLT